MKYFELPPNHTFAIEDAIGFVATESIDHPRSYDYIIHDVFTGGAEPTALFTVEFLEGLEKLLKDDGVIAIVRLAPIDIDRKMLTVVELRWRHDPSTSPNNPQNN